MLVGALSVLLTAPTRVGAATEVEGAGYGGTSVGAWTCGPVGRVNYGGVGARVRVSQNPGAFGGKGYSVEVAAAGEFERTRIVQCDSQSPCTSSPPDVLTGGTHIRAGYRGSVATIDLGLSAFGGWNDPTDGAQTLQAFPDFELGLFTGRFGRALGGIGTPTVTTLRRPGAYLGYDLSLEWVDLETRLGVLRAGPALLDDSALRADLAVLVPLTGGLKLRLGGSVSGNDNGNGGEGSAGLRGTL